MPIYHGSTPVGSLYFGSTSIGRVYHGSTLVFEKVVVPEGPFTFGNPNPTVATTLSADRTYLARIFPDRNCTIKSIGFKASSNRASSFFTGVIYADNGGNPDGGALLATTVEQIDTVKDATYNLNLLTPLPASASVPLWAGFIIGGLNTATVYLKSTATSTNYRTFADTYSDGPLAVCPTTNAAGTTELGFWVTTT